MKKIITAIGTNELIKKLKEKENLEIIGNDIPYQDGVLDILKGNSEINTVILSEILPGEYKIKDFISELRKINPYLEIIFFMKEENEELRNFLVGNGIKKIYIDGEFSLNEIVDGICFVNTEVNLNLEIEKLKKMIEEKSSSEDETKNKSKKKEKVFKMDKTIAITGYYGSGKSLITAMLAKAADKLNLKVIIIDFDILNNSVNNLFNISKYKKNYNYEKIEQYIMKINSNISIFTGIDMLFNENNKINFEKIKKLLDKLKEDYDLILIDTSSETNLNYVKTALVNAQKIIFLIEPNLLEIKKSKDLLEIYLEDWQIPEYKFDIVLNKVNINSVSKEIVKNLFSKVKIVGEIGLSKSYTTLANNIKTNAVGINEYKKILKKLS